MNEDNLNMEIRKFLKKVGITSQRILENEINLADKKGLIKLGDSIDIQMQLKIESIGLANTISGKINIE
tara:strand:- start:206 stop:412 length:207 start_codon:yes stop_codon:yes gene_type:complete